MGKGAVYLNSRQAGWLEKTGDGKFIFRYDAAYLKDQQAPSISLTLPKTDPVHVAEELFPFFQGLLAEGVNKQIQCRLLRIDEEDDFTRLLRTAGEDTIGAVTVKGLAE
jgi:serine/threonine-protein kinase HipA